MYYYYTPAQLPAEIREGFDARREKEKEEGGEGGRELIASNEMEVVCADVVVGVVEGGEVVRRVSGEGDGEERVKQGMWWWKERFDVMKGKNLVRFL